MAKSNKDYILEFFKNNPNEIFQLKEIDAAVKDAYMKDHGNNEIYVNRTPRQLVKQGYIPQLGGYLERPQRGSFRFVLGKKPLTPKSPFTQRIKNQIIIRDEYKCQMCGVLETTNNKLAIDHIVPEDAGGEGILENGITLCFDCNNTKKNLNVTMFGKKLFEKYLVIAKSSNDEKTISFLNDLLDVYGKHRRK